jgi:dynein heavy chain
MLFYFLLQNALRNLVQNSIALYLETVESPALSILSVAEDFVWGNDLVNTQFISPVSPLFNIEIMMNDTCAYYSTDLQLFEV